MPSSRHIPIRLKLQLVREAGGKCANPGCPNRRVEIHHIRKWSVYKSHDALHMIAICPSCHDAAEHGTLRIDDPTIYQWKAVKRAKGVRVHDQIWIEPGTPTSVDFGGIRIRSQNSVVVFHLSRANKFSFSVESGEILGLDIDVQDLQGRDVVRVRHGTLTLHDERRVEYDRRQGRVRVRCAPTPEFVPEWLSTAVDDLVRATHLEPPIPEGQPVTLLEIEAIGPGMARVEGLWVEGQAAVIAVPSSVVLANRELGASAISALTLDIGLMPVTMRVFGRDGAFGFPLDP